MEPTWPWLRELETSIKNISESKISCNNNKIRAPRSL